MSLSTRCVPVAAAFALAASILVPAASAIASGAPVAASLRITVPGTPIVCRQETEVSVLVLDADGATIAGTEVSWGLAPVVSSQDGITAPISTTDSQGIATTKVWIDCIPGGRTLLVKADDAIASAILAISTEGMPSPTPTPVPPAATAASLAITLPAEPIACMHLTEVSVLVTDASGATIAGKTVAWSLMPFASTEDSWTDMESVTGSQGVATTQVWIACIPGARTINASADAVTASAELAISEEGMPGTGPTASEPALTAPPTATEPPATSRDEAPGWLLLTMAAAVAGLAGLLLARPRAHARR